MNPLMQQLQRWLGPNAKAIRALMAPLVVVMILAMMVLPLPPFVLDLLFTFNIAMALMVMMVAAYMVRPLDFAAFPAVILLTTLLRLSLNVASTRIVLLDGHTGSAAAGKVIESFGHFLIGGNFAVGLIVFAILVVINFVVVTKGAERIAEVGARFTLDAMPGKQMAIDADMNAGLIDEKEAKRRRAEVGDEAEFFGSMDGASKYVRGDAMAGLLILFINIIGGFVIGLAQHGLTASQAADSYVLLAVGDALVAQIPALLISVAAAMVVSRVGKEADVGSQITKQVFSSPRSLAVVAGVLAIIGSIPGMPHLVFLLIGAGLGWGGWMLRQAQQRAANAPKPAPPPLEANAEATLGRPAAGRHARARGRLSPDRSRRQGAPGRPARAHQGRAAQVRAGRRLPAAAGAHPRQPRAEAERVPADAARRRRRRRRGVSRHVAGDQPGRRDDAAARHGDDRPRVRPACDVDRGAPARNGADGRVSRSLIARPSSRPTSHT